MLSPPRFFPAAAVLVLVCLSLAACLMSRDHTDHTPEQVLPRLLAVLKDPNPELRRTAAQSLGKIARKEAVSVLVEALRDPDAGVRSHAAWALGMIGEDSVGRDRSPLGALLLDSDPGVREAAATALGQTGDTQSGIELLQELLLESGVSNDTKRLTVAALGGMEARSAVLSVTKMLQDRDPLVRRWAEAALAEIGDPQAVGPLSLLLRKDPDSGVRIEAAFRLGKFGGKAARPALTAALNDANENVRRLAAAALKEMAGTGNS